MGQKVDMIPVEYPEEKKTKPIFPFNPTIMGHFAAFPPPFNKKRKNHRLKKVMIFPFN